MKGVAACLVSVFEFLQRSLRIPLVAFSKFRWQRLLQRDDAVALKTSRILLLGLLGCS